MVVGDVEDLQVGAVAKAPTRDVGLPQLPPVPLRASVPDLSSRLQRAGGRGCRSPVLCSLLLRSRGYRAILSLVAQYSSALDDVFAALADPTRRAVVGRLGHGPASIGELAQSTSMTLPSFMKHIHTLERCELIHTVKSGRVRTCSLNRRRLGLVDGWLAEHRAIWEDRTDRLEQFVTNRGEPS